MSGSMHSGGSFKDEIYPDRVFQHHSQVGKWGKMGGNAEKGGRQNGICLKKWGRMGEEKWDVIGKMSRIR